MVGEAGIEPTTPGLEGRCSIQLSYSPLRDLKAQPLNPYCSEPVAGRHYSAGCGFGRRRAAKLSVNNPPAANAPRGTNCATPHRSNSNRSTWNNLVPVPELI